MQYNIVWGSFNNYVDKKRATVSVHAWSCDKGQVIYKVSTIVHSKGRGSKLGKVWSTQLLNDPMCTLLSRSQTHSAAPEPRATTWGLCSLVGQLAFIPSRDNISPGTTFLKQPFHIFTITPGTSLILGSYLTDYKLNVFFNFLREHSHMTSDFQVGRQVKLHLILLNRLMQ